ncbi:MAG: acylphosphatase [Acidobacteriota bacterium]
MGKSLHCLVSGRVQGVGFRAFVFRRALELGLCGWARNLPDGRVEVLVQGLDHARDAFLRSLRKGPLLSRVDHVVTDLIDGEPDYPDFQIKH